MTVRTIDLSDERFERGVPYETFAYLRETSPVWWWPEAGAWAVTTHALVEQMNRDWPTFSSVGGIVPPGSTINPGMLLGMDPPVHTEYRRLIVPAFMPRSIAKLEHDARVIARDVVDEYVAAGGGDFVTEVAARIPFRVMADLTAVPWSAEDDVMRWGHAIAPNSDPEYRPTPTAMADANEALSEFLGEQLAARRANPGDDLFSQLLAARTGAGPLPEADLRGYGVNYLLGGTETTRNLLGNGMVTLLEHPEQVRRFVDGEVSTATAVDELLRYVTPILHHSRHVTHDAEVAGQQLHAGDRVTLWMSSANRDPAVFAEPEQLDLGRTPNPHTALGGGGPHYCVGSHLAKLEAAVTLEALRDVLPRLVAAGPAERVRSNFINGIKHLVLTVGP
jgi:cholest-4-en-3-one 26-monooxygenase